MAPEKAQRPGDESAGIERPDYTPKQSSDEKPPTFPRTLLSLIRNAIVELFEAALAGGHLILILVIAVAIHNACDYAVDKHHIAAVTMSQIYDAPNVGAALDTIGDGFEYLGFRGAERGLYALDIYFLLRTLYRRGKRKD
jgi:hypothetical protein